MSVDMLALFSQVMVPFLIMFFGLLVYMEWRRYQRRQEEREQLMQYREAEDKERIEVERTAGAGTGGFIVVNLPKEKRSLFHDLLKGFEEYAHLKGYEISFSIDATYSDKIAFKFTIDPSVVSVSPETVKADFREYISKIETGEPLHDLPVVLSQQEHDLLITKMRNRINFLQHSYNLEKNTVKYYENLLQNVSSARLLSAPNVLVQTGGTMDSRNYNASNSSHFIQGDDNKYEDSSLSVSIDIGNSFNERKDRIEKVDRLIEVLQGDSSLDPTHKTNAIKHLAKVKDELTDEQKPDTSRIKKWLGVVKESLEFLSLGKTAVEIAVIMFNAFGFPTTFGV